MLCMVAVYSAICNILNIRSAIRIKRLTWPVGELSALADAIIV